MHTNNLEMKLEILLCAWRHRVFGICCWLSVWTEPGEWFFRQYCIHLL